MECPVCEYPDAVIQYELGDRFFRTTPDRFVLFLCESCGLTFQDARIQARLSEFYPDAYWSKPTGGWSRLETGYRDWILRHDHLEFLQKVVPNPKNCSLLDIGCGGGLFVKLVRSLGCQALGLDNAALPGVSEEDRGFIRIGSIDDLIGEGAQFDVVTMFHTLEHVPDPFPFMKKVRQLIRKPGGLIVQVPNRSSFQARLFGKRWYGLDCPRHVCNYSQYALLHLLGRAGFRLQRTRHFSLRDNAPALVSSLLPALDPVSQRVQRIRQDGSLKSPIDFGLREVLYFGLVLGAQPLAWLEAKLGRGATLTVFATWE